jgi:hypothetical protein
MEAPIREAEARRAADLLELQEQLAKAGGKVFATIRERVEKGRDDEVQIDPATPAGAISVPAEKVSEWNLE